MAERSAAPGLRGRSAPAPRRQVGAVRALQGLVADPGLRLAVVVVVAMRVTLGVAALAGIAVQADDRPSGDHLDAATPTSSALWPLIGPFERWDGLWYLHLARDGYAPGSGDGAYEPLFPALLRAVSVLLGGNVGLAAWLVVTVALVAGLALVWHLVGDVLGARIASRTVLIMAVYPGAFFLLSPYPEPVFLALTAGTLLAARRRRWGDAGGLALLATLCRPQGVVVVLAVGVEALLAARTASAATSGRRSRLAGVISTVRAINLEMVAACALPVVALAGWFAYCRTRLDLPLGPLTPLRDKWGHHAAWPWQVVADSIHSVATVGRDEEVGNLVMLGLVLLSLPLMWRLLPRSWTVYTAATVAVAIGGEARWTPLMSWMRYAAVLVPFFALLAMGAARLPRWARLGAGAGALGLELWAFHLYVHHAFIA